MCVYIYMFCILCLCIMCVYLCLDIMCVCVLCAHVFVCLLCVCVYYDSGDGLGSVVVCVVHKQRVPQFKPPE